MSPQQKADKALKVSSQDTSAAVDDFMNGLQHPFKPEIELLREVFLQLGSGVAEGIKWNVPSFRTSSYFATLHLRGKGTIGVILHLGAKARELPSGGLGIDDPEGLLKWLANDRALIEFKSASEIRAHRKALERILRQWVEKV